MTNDQALAGTVREGSESEVRGERDQQEAVAMLFEAHRERDAFLIERAMKHLDSLEFRNSLFNYRIVEDRQ